MKNYEFYKMKYRFDPNDIRALLSVLDTTFTITVGLGFAWVGVAMGFIGFVNDIAKKHKINEYVLHLSSLVVNLYLVYLSYKLK